MNTNIYTASVIHFYINIVFTMTTAENKVFYMMK